jgi:hypothetical protein
MGLQHGLVLIRFQLGLIKIMNIFFLKLICTQFEPLLVKIMDPRVDFARIMAKE